MPIPTEKDGVGIGVYIFLKRFTVAVQASIRLKTLHET